MATTSNIYPKHVSNVIIGKGDGVAGRNYQTVAHKYGGNTMPCDTLFSQDAFNSIPDGSTVNSLTIVFEGALTDNNGDKSTYKKGKWSVDKIGYPQGWNGVYTGYNNLPSIDWIANVGYTTGELQYDWKTYSCSVSGITLAHLRAGLFIRTSAHHITSMGTSSRFYMRNFHVVVDYTEPPYTITYNGNGATSGSVASQSGYVGENLTLASNSFIKRACVSLYSNDIDGCEYNDDEDRIVPPLLSEASFLGWYTAAEGGTKVGDGGASYTPSGNVTLYAHWSGYPAVTLPTLTREGFAFLGWYDDREGGTKAADGGESYTPMQSYEPLFAHWASSTIKLIYLGNKATSFYLGQKPVSKIFKGNTEIYYDPFAEE